MLGTLLLLALIPSATAAATRPITFRLSLDRSCIDGQASNDATVKLTWRDAAGELKAKATVETDTNGNWYQCFGDDPDSLFDPDYVVEVGDLIKGTVGSATRTFVVPKVTIQLDRVADVFRGKAPAGSTIQLEWLTGLFGDIEDGATVEARADGTWSFHPKNGVIGGEWVCMTWASPKNDTIVLCRQAPYLVVTLGKSRFSGATRPGRTVEIAIEDGTTTELKATGIAVGDPWRGGLAGHFEDEQGDRVAITAGDHLSAPAIASDADWIVPRVHGRANASTNVVNGQCFDTGSSANFFQIIVRSPSGHWRGSAWGNAAGPFEVDFSDPPGPWPDPTNIRVGDRISVRCLQETGDWVQKNFVVT